MENYLNGKPDDFDGIAVKRFLLGQAREQVSWYRQSIEALDYVGCIVCRRALESGQGFLEHYLPAHNIRETERGTEYQRDTAFPLLPNSIKPNASQIWQLRTGSDRAPVIGSSMRSSNVVIFTSPGGFRITGIPILFGFQGRVDCVHSLLVYKGIIVRVGQKRIIQ